MVGKELWIWWHWTGNKDQASPHAMVYTAIESLTQTMEAKTDSYRRGHGGWVEVLTPLKP